MAAATDFDPVRFERLAVVVEDATQRIRGAEGLLRQIDDEFLQQLVGKGYRVADRSQRDNAIRELRFQHSGYTAEEASRIGRMLNVPAVLIVAITEVNTSRYVPTIQLGRTGPQELAHATLSARLVSVETTEVLWVGSHSLTTYIEDRRTQAMSAVAPTASALARAFPSRLPSNEEDENGAGARDQSSR